jgi:hypothetical protein
MSGVADAVPAHRWESPVIMKTQPDRVAYTCARCGAIGVPGVGEPPSDLDASAFALGEPQAACVIETARARDQRRR